jgi:hypothetical protein
MSATFPPSERAVLLAVKGVGPTVIARLEQIGIASLADLAHRDATAICDHVAAMLGGTCWRNAPRARAAIQSAIDAARAST